MTAIDEIKAHINAGKNFVLQGGAGSGKTESLKQLLEFISENYPEKKIACITHTNLAVNEIKSRVGERYTISTIHSFLNSFIKDYKKNIHSVIYEIFKLEKVERKDISFYSSETEQKKEEHENYKSKYKKYADKLFSIKKESTQKVEGKREYDLEPEKYNQILNDKISLLNQEIKEIIEKKDYVDIEYNETRFNDFRDLTYSHDGLLDISYLLFKKYKVIGKILQDKYDYIFIDEYQDTNPNVIEIFLELLPQSNKTLIGLFGDSMQAIYDDGIGDVNKQVSNGLLARVDKEDNYRCSLQVVDYINQLRNDDLVQEVALKTIKGIQEKIEDRQGTVTLYYSLYPKKPNAFSSQEERDSYLSALSDLVNHALDGDDSYRQLKLSNRSIASDTGFESLYSIFSDRYIEPQDHMEKDLSRLQFLELYELFSSYKSNNFNFVLSSLKRRRFSIKSIADKELLKNKFETINNSDIGAIEALQKSFDLKLINKSDKHDSYINYKNEFLSSLSLDASYQELKAVYFDGGNTFNRMSGKGVAIEEEDFNELDKVIKKEKFYNSLFSNELKFWDILNYYDYLSEKTKYITMHKTKGSGIDNVLVVLEEYFWSAYNFSEVFLPANNNPERKERSTKLVYVAASRAKHNLKFVKLISQDEEAEMLKFFNSAIKV
jgi:DNA helicase-2/ATP-dependent DNA helicase PcrA